METSLVRAGVCSLTVGRPTDDSVPDSRLGAGAPRLVACPLPPSACSRSRAMSASTSPRSTASAWRTCAVRRPAELEACDALVIPGGESTTMAKLARIFDLFEPLRSGSRAGHAGVRHLRRDDHARRPGRGRRRRAGDARRPRHHRAAQRLRPPGRLLRGRPRLRGPRRRRSMRCSSAPPGSRRWVPRSRCSPEWARGEAAGRIVAVRQGPLMATSFHPEVSGGRPHPPALLRPRRQQRSREGTR